MNYELQAAKGFFSASKYTNMKNFRICSIPTSSDPSVNLRWLHVPNNIPAVSQLSALYRVTNHVCVAPIEGPTRRLFTQCRSIWSTFEPFTSLTWDKISAIRLIQFVTCAMARPSSLANCQKTTQSGPTISPRRQSPSHNSTSAANSMQKCHY
jgi:hypothetical protein